MARMECDERLDASLGACAQERFTDPVFIARLLMDPDILLFFKICLTLVWPLVLTI